MLVSIIIPFYNSAHNLELSIKSALSQTYPKKEIILVDDGSLDGSFEIAKKYESSNLKVLKQINSGAAVARNTGLQIAKGKYIQFLDAGDLLDSDKIENQIIELNGSDSSVAVCDYIQFARDEDLNKVIKPNQSAFIYSSNDPVDFLVNLWGGNGSCNFIQTNCWLTPRALIEKVGGWRNYRCPDDDGEFFSRIILASTSIIHTPGVYNYYRTDSTANRLSSNKSRKYLMNTLLTIDLKRSYLLSRGNHKNLDIALARQYWEFAIYAYPNQKILSEIAYRRFKKYKVKLSTPMLGGFFIEMINKIFGWKLARSLRSYLAE